MTTQMAIVKQQSISNKVESATSSDRSQSLRDFVEAEKLCKTNSDDEMKGILDQIIKLSGGCAATNTVSLDNDNIEGIIKQAQQLVQESTEMYPFSNSKNTIPRLAQIASNVTVKTDENRNLTNMKNCGTNIDKGGAGDVPFAENSLQIKTKLPGTSNTAKLRPKSASFAESKNKESGKILKNAAAQRRANLQRNEDIVEELNNTTERVKRLELHNATLIDNQKVFRTKCDTLSARNHTLEIQLTESQDLFDKLKRQFDSVKNENSNLHSAHNKLFADLAKEKDDRKNSSLYHEKDKIVIQDLQRQCKEMERILQRKHPDSVSALIVASKPSTREDETRKLLDKRIDHLEWELKEKDIKFQGILLNLQEKFGVMKTKYESHISDLETRLAEYHNMNLNLNNKITKANMVDRDIQTDILKQQVSIGVQICTKAKERPIASQRSSTCSALLSSRLKEESHLLATIKGLQAELGSKDKILIKVTREAESLRKSVNKLHKEKIALMKLNPHEKFIRMRQAAKSADNLLGRVNSDLEAELDDFKKQKTKLVNERDRLLQSLKIMEADYVDLKKKRIQDLNSLQMDHENEITQVNVQIYPLKEELHAMNETMERFRNQLRVTEDKLMLTRAERDELRKLCEKENIRESNARSPRGNERPADYNVLKQKVMLLERRYSEREARLKGLVYSLTKMQSLYRASSQSYKPDCDNCTERNKQMRSHRVQLDHMLSTLRGVTGAANSLQTTSSY